MGAKGKRPHEVLVLVMWLCQWLWPAVNMETWISHKVLRLPEKKTAFDTSRETPKTPKWGRPQKEINVL